MDVNLQLRNCEPESLFRLRSALAGHRATTGKWLELRNVTHSTASHLLPDRVLCSPLSLILWLMSLLGVECTRLLFAHLLWMEAAFETASLRFSFVWSCMVVERCPSHLRKDSNTAVTVKHFDFFYLIVGTGVHGIPALFLARPRMTVDKCVSAGEQYYFLTPYFSDRALAGVLSHAKCRRIITGQLWGRSWG
jgi:hypothetical protein